MSGDIIPAGGGSMRSVGQEQVASRQMAEVQAAMAIAKRFPRDENAAIARIDTACSRPGLASESQYEYSKGGSKIKGPSIRLAEVLAQNWGNIDFGWSELERYEADDGVGVSVIMAYAWDLQNNTRRPLVFNVRHWRDTKTGGYAIKEERDIYELNANMAARRMRTCILNIIPGDVADLAIAKCDKTLAGQTQEPIEDAVRKMVIAFKEYGVTVDMLAKSIGSDLAAMSHNQLASLRKKYQALKDGVATRDDLFSVSTEDDEEKPTSKAEQTAKKLDEKKAAKKEPTKAKEEKKDPEQEAQSNEGERQGDDVEIPLEEDQSPKFAEFRKFLHNCKKKADYQRLLDQIHKEGNPFGLTPPEMLAAAKMCRQSIDNA